MAAPLHHVVAQLSPGMKKGKTPRKPLASAWTAECGEKFGQLKNTLVSAPVLAYADCTVYTDNNPLRHLDTTKLGAVGQRWGAQLAPFNLTLKYCPGAQNGNADALSRQYREASTTEASEEEKECEGQTLCIQTDISVLPCCSKENLATL